MGGGRQVDGVVNDRYHIARADRLGRFAGGINDLDQRRPAGGHREVAVGHQFGGLGMTGFLDALHQVHRGSDLFEGLAHVLNRFIGSFLGTRMRRYDLGVSGLQGAQRQTADRRFRIGAGHDIGDDTDRFSVFADTQGLVLFDHAAGLGIAHVPEGSQGLVLDFVHFVFGIADIRFIHRHMAQLVANVFFHKLPGHGLNHFIHFFLWPEFDFAKRFSGFRVHFLNVVFHCRSPLYKNF